MKLGGGMISHIQSELEISCLPKDIPENITVDIAELELGHSVHLSEVKLPANVELATLLTKNMIHLLSVVMSLKLKKLKKLRQHQQMMKLAILMIIPKQMLTLIPKKKIVNSLL